MSIYLTFFLTNFYKDKVINAVDQNLEVVYFSVLYKPTIHT